MVYDIALGSKRSSTATKKYSWEWKEIVERLSKAQKTEETAAQFAAMSKSQRVEVKDVGFFIGGLCDRRKVTWRQLLVLDIDDANDKTLEKLREWLNGSHHLKRSSSVP